MTNKFQKSVFERQKAEAERKQNISSTPKLFLDKDEQATEKNTVQDQLLPSREKTSSDIASLIRPRTTRLAKNKTFYLDGELIEIIQATAKSQKITESRLVNDILRSVLGI